MYNYIYLLENQLYIVLIVFFVARVFKNPRNRYGFCISSMILPAGGRRGRLGFVLLAVLFK